ncbi:MAG: ankyrin repeat domain-containing protein [Alphaproteobacteria bacterium]|nr:ankyrin repeat domain-containing protein [Alphaproteobacteria bacterium]
MTRRKRKKQMTVEEALENEDSCVQFVLEHKNLNVCTSKGTPLLIGAVCHKYDRATRLMIEKKADLNIRSTDGSTPLMLAAAYGSPDITRKFVESGANVNAQNNWGATAISLAVMHDDDIDHIRALLDAGADPNHINHRGEPLLLTALYKGEGLIRLLVQKGANPQEIINNPTPSSPHRCTTIAEKAREILDDDIADMMLTEERKRIARTFETAAQQGTSKPRKIRRPTLTRKP